MKITGKCACGEVQYEFNEAPGYSFHCHCRQCQQFSGTGHSSQILISDDSFKVSGEVQFFTQKADSEFEVSRGFCSTCGSPLFNIPGRMPEKRFIHVASLDNPSLFEPTDSLYEESRHPWDHQNVLNKSE